MAKILICTGIYPPHVGGPSQYAKEVENELLSRKRHQVKVLTYTLERKLPPLVRHQLFFWKVLFNLRGVDFILALDQFSVGWPAAMAAKIMKKTILIRTGGDFLWESYVERTGDLVLFKNFYNTSRGKLNFKERFIFQATKWTLQNVTAVLFSTEWQRAIFTEAYGLDSKKTHIIENFYGKKIEGKPIRKKKEIKGEVKRKSLEPEPEKKVFVAGTRPLKWKNIQRLKEAFEIVQKKHPEIVLDTNAAPYEEFQEKIKNSYAVILVSIGDISPNMILDAIRSNKPFILTEENGLYDRIKNIGLFIDPKNTIDISNKIEMLCNPRIYEEQKKKVAAFKHTHSWKEICDDIIFVAFTAHIL